MAELLVTALEVVGTQGSYVLGDVMVEAICGRALARAQLSHPCLGAFDGRLSASSSARAVLETTTSGDELHAATRLVVTSLLHALCHLTGGALTARLCENLDAVGARERRKVTQVKKTRTARRGGRP